MPELEHNPSPLPIQPGETAKHSETELKPFTFYANYLRPKLPKEVFELRPTRIIWLFTYGGLAALCFLAIASGQFAWPVKILLGALAGFCFGALGFLSHELLHGSVVRNRFLQDFFAFFCFMPFLISPTFWRYWHNQLHHGKTQSVIADPDAFPNMRIFRSSKFMQFMFPFTPGSGYLRSYIYFGFWFSFHVLVAQNYLRFRNSIYDRLNHRRVSWEFGGQILLMLAIYALVGPSQILYTFAIPLIVQNYFVMSYIATNHNLSPLTRVNDPLVNSLTVTNNPTLEWLQLNFGYHVEHHIFPAVSGAHAKKIHQVLKQEFGTKFKVMPKFVAMKALYKTARIYKDSNTLINPRTGETYPTI